MTGATVNVNEELEALHERLHAHFSALQARRQAMAPGTPLFALEHGLPEADVLLLQTYVSTSVQRRNLPRHSWLPFVVYAAEVGYEYSGDEYWQTFEARTPGWAEHGDRQYIRRKFRQFQETFAAAEPRGAWARHFSIIAWPITHAVLPRDLQRHLARLLFEYRHALTNELLTTPSALGERLAARALYTSSRFQSFAQNTDLLGRVAAALLIGDDEPSPHLLDSTLTRIVDDLSQERQARRWLHGAKSSAEQVRNRGFRRPGRTAGDRSSGEPRRAPLPTDPGIGLRREDDGWAAYLELPDLSILADRLPDVVDELRQRRVKLAGSSGPPLAPSRLLFVGQRLRLEQWPPRDVPLLRLENGSAAANSLLADQCVVSAGPTWLFRLVDRGRAIEVRGRLVRPGQQYVVLSENPLPLDIPTWVEPAACVVGGVDCSLVKVPEHLDDEEIAALREIGLGVVTEVEIRPVGLVPPLWDGEGRAEWLAGEDPTVALACTRSVERCILSLDGQLELLAWPEGADRVFVRAAGLGVGSHELGVSLIGPDHEEPISEGTLDLLIRPRRSRPATGSFQEGLLLLPSPVSPALTELWDGTAAVEIRGPAGAQVGIQLLLSHRDGRQLARRSTRISLPVTGSDWANFFGREFRQAPDMQRVYDDAERGVVSVSHVDLGTVSLRCERPFSPLRWAVGGDRHESVLRLIDNTGGDATQIVLFEFNRPDESIRLDLDGDGQVRLHSGGLLMARAGENSAAVVVPQAVRALGDIGLSPRLNTRARSMPEIRGLVDLAADWTEASLTANPFGAYGRVQVLRAFTAYLASLIGGNRWAAIERRVADESSQVSSHDLQLAVGEARYQRELAQELLRWLDPLRVARPEDRVQVFAEALSVHAHSAGVHGEDVRLAEFLLRLASEPGSVARWPETDAHAFLHLTFDSPVLLRAARLMVISIDRVEQSTAGETFGGWAWQ